MHIGTSQRIQIEICKSHTQNVCQSISSASGGGYISLKFSPGAALLVVIHGSKLQVWDMELGKEVTMLGYESKLTGVAFS